MKSNESRKIQVDRIEKSSSASINNRIMSFPVSSKMTVMAGLSPFRPRFTLQHWVYTRSDQILMRMRTNWSYRVVPGAAAEPPHYFHFQ
jgi:hypothetical protein